MAPGTRAAARSARLAASASASGIECTLQQRVRPRERASEQRGGEREAERDTAAAKLGKSCEITRFKGLGEISPNEFKQFIGKGMKLSQVEYAPRTDAANILTFYMGKNTPDRQDFIIENLRVEKDLVEAVARGIAPRPAVADARLSLIHVADLAEAVVRALESDLAASVYEVDDGHPGGHTYDDMARAAGLALKVGDLKGREVGRQPWILAIPRPVLAAVGAWNGLRQSLGGAPQILTAGKVAEMFHPDWTIHDRRLAEATGFSARYDLQRGFADTVLWYRQRRWLGNR